ncbi:MAG: hypothetical protein OEX10_04745 [Candidatus Bathyarchaeota archaeon]|nr:hypothetical protein [Candidatus Bathyarchaeota archaeon]MDH5664541.1 hypothetical protein [Candidatus Bathyarchaeota archaeon]
MGSLEVVKEEDNDFVVKVLEREKFVKIENTFAETCRFIVTAHSVLV